jgi:DNA-binding NarL/FixJ family response regulator
MAVAVKPTSRRRVLLVDDNAAVRSMVRRLFEWEPDFEISGEAADGRDAVEKVEILKPDLIILDLTMPVMTGVEEAPLIKTLAPDARIILFTVHEGREVERLALEAGVHAIVSKNHAASKLVPQARALLQSTEQEHNLGNLQDAS